MLVAAWRLAHGDNASEWSLRVACLLMGALTIVVAAVGIGVMLFQNRGGMPNPFVMAAYSVIYSLAEAAIPLAAAAILRGEIR